MLSKLDVIALANILAAGLEYKWDEEFLKEEVFSRPGLRDMSFSELTDQINELFPGEDKLFTALKTFVNLAFPRLENDIIYGDIREAIEVERYRGRHDIDISKYSRKNLKQLGFIQYSKKANNDGKYLMLIPIWASLMLPDMEVTSIFGDIDTLYKCDKDIRGGCLAFGLFVD